MKLQLFKLFFATLVIGMAGAGSALAQTALSFDVPFEFYVGKTRLEAGKYQIRKTNAENFIVKNLETDESIIVASMTEVGTDREVNTENIVFHRYGDTYFLREIYTRRGTAGRELAESKAERKLRKGEPKLARNKTEKVTIGSTQ